MNRELMRKILEYMKKAGKVVTTKEISDVFNISWNTAEKYLMELALEGKVERVKKVGVNIWILKP